MVRFLTPGLSDPRNLPEYVFLNPTMLDCLTSASDVPNVEINYLYALVHRYLSIWWSDSYGSSRWT